MTAGLRLVFRTTLSTREVSCVICDEPFDLPRTGAALFDGSTPRGYVCRGCVAGGPGRAALQVRGRARWLHAQAEKLRALFPGAEWVSVVQATHERAGRWDALAQRVAGLTHWPVELE